MSVEARTTRSITLDFYSLDDLRALVEERPRLSLDPKVAEKIEAGARYVQRKAQEDRYIYGVNTGFGSLCETRVRPDEVELLQYNHVVSHACGVGEPVSENVSRLVLLIKLLTFRTGHTGVSLETVNRLLDFWNHDVIPVIPKKGTVGASGDLAPLAHLSLPLLGLGKVHFRGGVAPAAEVLPVFGWEPLRLKAKEGLALTNGVQYINAIAAECLMTIGDMVGCVDLIASISLQAFSASRTFYQAPYHETSYHLERRAVAANLRRLLEGSNHFELSTCNQSMQDPYSFRCIPQVHGAVRQAYGFARSTMENEVNGVSDNPLFFPEQDLILFGGNLHGESTALSLDFVAMATSELANISERRTYQLLSGQRGLPSFLIKTPGINSGLMVPQYTSAALVNQNKVLSAPACVDTIPTCQLQEDHVSMGGTSAYKLQEIIQNCWWVFAIELLTAVQAVDLNGALRLSPTTAQIVRELRGEVPFLDRDRVMSDDIDRARDLLVRRAPTWARDLSLI
uniref:Histidine ammonia-lyase n=1 Tax=Phaselicystis flava TaxID=525924 RepID=A0A3S5GYG7_9BACT|nr:histidine ammonia-lyase [Phaselicystis flava]